KLSDTNILEQSQESFICQATEVGFISDNTVSIDAKHVEAQDQAPPEKATQSKPALKKHQRKSKDECDQWLNAAAEKAANLPLYEKTIAAQLDATLADLRDDIPQDPKWVIRKSQKVKMCSGMTTKPIWWSVQTACIFYNPFFPAGS